MTIRRAIGVDGAPGGWITAAQVVEPGGAGVVEFTFCERFSSIVDMSGPHDVIVVDMPIGLSDDGVRHADDLARQRLGSRRSTFFPTPVRGVLTFDEWADANEHSKQVTGKGLSKQAWNLVPKIREVEGAWSPSLADRLFEGHPETSFAQMGGSPVLSKKSTAEGRNERLGLLAAHVGGSVPAAVSQLAAKFRVDAIDACAVLWTARRILCGEAIVIGDQTDSTGRPMALSI